MSGWAAKSLCILVSVTDFKVWQDLRWAGGVQGPQQAELTPVLCGDEWQGVSWEKNFL